MIKILSFLITLALFCHLSAASEMSPDGEFDSSFTHVVYFWLKEPNNTQHREQFEGAVRKFMAESEYAKTRFVGVAPKATREVVDDSFTYSLILSFESAEAQQKYQVEVSHLEFVETCKDLWDKVIVYDSLPLQ